MRLARLSAAADADLDRIDQFLLGIDPALANSAAIAIRDRIALVCATPAVGTPLPGGRRKIIERRFGYVIFYRETAGAVLILRIRHAREDWR
jgi:plasmid stabilization system protein ParE